MNAAVVRTSLVEVLQEIQAASGLECPALVGETKSLEVLPKFDSKIWPVAIGMLAAKLGVVIANDVNIFRKEKSCIALTLDESVELVVALVDAQAPAQQAAQAANAK